MERNRLIKQLLTSFHLNNIERAIFNNSPITLSEVSDCIHLFFSENNCFPPQALDKGAVFEGYHIEKVNENKFKLVYQHHSAINPFVLSEMIEIEYSGFDKLIHDYISKEYKFNIDGIEIVK